MFFSRRIAANRDVSIGRKSRASKQEHFAVRGYANKLQLTASRSCSDGKRGCETGDQNFGVLLGREHESVRLPFCGSRNRDFQRKFGLGLVSTGHLWRADDEAIVVDSHSVCDPLKRI